MKCRVIRDDLEVAPNSPSEKTEGRIVVLKVMRNSQMTDVVFWKRDAIIDHPQAFRLVQQGCALPADKECEERCQRNAEQLTAAQMAYERLHRGIHPDDFALFDAGIIEGYNDDGSYKPGKNADRHPEVFEDEGDE